MPDKRKWLVGLVAVLVVAAGIVVASVGDDEEPESPATEQPGDAREPEPTTSPAAPDPDQPVSTPATDPGAPEPDSQVQVVEPRPGMSDVRPIGWNDYELLNEGLVRVFFTSGVEPCYVLDRVEVQNRPDEVEITLYQGSDPSAGDVACIEIAVQKAVDVRLEEPLANRTIVDGSQP